MKHPYADILICIAEGKNIQWRNGAGYWADADPTSTLDAIAHNAWPSVRYRVKPATITINGVECEAPVKATGSASWIRFNTFNDECLIHFDTQAARDAAYAALIKPFGEAK